MTAMAHAASGGLLDLGIAETEAADLQSVTGTRGLSGSGAEAVQTAQGAAAAQADPLGAIADLVIREGISGEEIEEALTVARFAR